MDTLKESVDKSKNKSSDAFNKKQKPSGKCK